MSSSTLLYFWVGIMNNTARAGICFVVSCHKTLTTAKYTKILNNNGVHINYTKFGLLQTPTSGSNKLFLKLLWVSHKNQFVDYVHKQKAHYPSESESSTIQVFLVYSSKSMTSCLHCNIHNMIVRYLHSLRQMGYFTQEQYKQLDNYIQVHRGEQLYG